VLIGRSEEKEDPMLKNAESVLFFLATVAALALPAVPALQEMRSGSNHATQAAAFPAASKRVVDAVRDVASPLQVAMFR
jgi:hypothetical protein